MFSKAGPVIITTKKLKVQLLAVDSAFAGPRILSPTISAGFGFMFSGSK